VPREFADPFTLKPSSHHPVGAMPPKKKKNPVNWLGSQGRAFLLKDIADGTITDGMKWRTVFGTRPEFEVGDTREEALRLFKGRLAAARKKIAEKKTRADREYSFLQQDLLVQPAPTRTHRGEPRWNDSAAQEFLKDDVKKGKIFTMTRTEFYNSRPEYYQNYTKKQSPHAFGKKSIRQSSLSSTAAKRDTPMSPTSSA
jgi:hypothetical protein